VLCYSETAVAQWLGAVLQWDSGGTVVRCCATVGQRWHSGYVLCYSGTAVAQWLGAVLQWDRGGTVVRCCATVGLRWHSG